MNYTIAFFKDRKGFEKRLEIAGTPPTIYRFAALPKIDIKSLFSYDDQEPSGSSIETVEFVLKGEKQIGENVWEAHYEEA